MESLAPVGSTDAGSEPSLWASPTSGYQTSWIHMGQVLSSSGESYSEWSSFCSQVVHNSCKNMISAMSTSKGGSQACVWKDLLGDQFCLSFYNWRLSIFDHVSSKELKAAFQFPALQSLLSAPPSPLNLRRFFRMEAENIWHNYLASICKLTLQEKK